MINLITVNWNSFDFLYVLMESLDRFSSYENNLIIIDNSECSTTVERKNTIMFKNNYNVGHGKGLNIGCKKAEELFPEVEYNMFLDVDSHFLRHGWEDDLIESMKEYDVIGGKGVPEKPIRPACMLFKSHLGTKYDWKDTDGYKGHRVTPDGFDVAIKAYYAMLEDGVKIGFLQQHKNRYGTLNGEEWSVNGNPFLYHHWHGTHLEHRQVDFPKNDLISDKNSLFNKIPWRIL